MVWKTNFDRHLDDFVLSHISKGETQLTHDSTLFAKEARPDTAAVQTSQTASQKPTKTAMAPGQLAHPQRLQAPRLTPETRPRSAAQASGEPPLQIDSQVWRSARNLCMRTCYPRRGCTFAWDTVLFPGRQSCGGILSCALHIAGYKLRHLCYILQSMCKPSSWALTAARTDM